MTQRFPFKLLLFSFLSLSCSMTPCREAKSNTQSSEAIKDFEKTPSGGGGMVSKARVWVYKYDGSKQCGEGMVIKLQDMEKGLSGITVYQRENRSDGMMHPSVCGGSTGRVNAYEIQSKDLPEALKRGFHLSKK